MGVADSLVNVINCYAFIEVSAIAMQLQATYHSLSGHLPNGILPISIHD